MQSKIENRKSKFPSNLRNSVQSKIENQKSKILYNAGQALPKAAHCGGQAMVEFTIAIVAIMAVVAGIVALNRLTFSHTNSMTAARAAAGELALSPVYWSSGDASFIGDWQTGADERRYTRDDEPMADFSSALLAHTIAGYSAPAGFETLPTNAVTRVLDSAVPIQEFYLVAGENEVAAHLGDIPAVSALFTREPTITVGSRVYLAWAEGIY